MKIQKLDLIRIGPFTDHSLLFDQGQHGFHLVYGANEAGKSSSLRALTQWLFGIAGETKCRDHFVHAHKDLRIGGTIENHAGETLTCIRRPGGQTSLRGEDDRKKLDPAVLSEFLGGLSRQQFETQFAIDIHQLVAGGKAIASGGGEIGESLFAAGSGAANMPAIQKSLDAQCDDLFKPSTAIKPKINAAIADLNSARKLVRETSVKSKDWQRQSDELAELRKKKAELDSQQIEHQSERDRLSRVRDALPAIGQWKDKQREREELGEVIRLRTDFTTQRVEVTTTLAAAQAAQKSASDERQSVSKKLEEIGELPLILDHASTVENLFENLSLYRQWMQSCPVVTAECQQLQQRAKTALKTLGKAPELEQVEGLRIGPAARVRIRELAEQRSGLLASADQAKRELDRRTSELEDLQREFDSVVEPEDTNALKNVIAAAQKLGDIDSVIQSKLNERNETQSVLEGKLKRLPLWGGTPEELSALAVPPTESLLRFGKDFERVDHSIKQLDEELRKLDDEIASAEESLETLTQDSDVPTEESLNAARTKRDQTWSEIRQRLQTSQDAINEEIVAFDEQVKHCDEISDRLRRESHRVSEKARLIALLQRCQSQIERRNAARENWQAERESLNEAWHGLWSPANITPLSPPEMSSWLMAHKELITLIDDNRRQSVEVERIQSTRKEHIATLQNHVKHDSETVELSPILDACIDRLETNNEIHHRFAQLDVQLQKLRREKNAAETTWEETKQAIANWQEQWQAAMVSLDGNAELTATEAQAVLDTIDQLMTDIDLASKLNSQAQTLLEQIAVFDQQVNRLADSLDWEIQEIPAEQVVANLHDQLKRTREDQLSRDHLLSQLEKLDHQRQSAIAIVEAQLATLQQLCQEAGCHSQDQLPAAEQRSENLHSLEQSIAQAASELRGFANGAELESFVADALQEDADRLTPRIEQLSEQLQEIEDERTRLSETIGGKQRDLDQIDGNDDAAAANEGAQHAIAQMRTHVEQYVRAKLGSAMLRRAVARYRKRNEGPILTRASELFAQFTLGNFSGLETDSNDDLENILVGIRTNDESLGNHQVITVDEMSEGTCDQLFLALRIASLEWHLESHPPVPFIVDDILLKFDDQRSAATLKCLGELSNKTQVIMFTHHQHLIDVARNAVPPEQLFIHSLDGSSEVRATPAITPKPKARKPKVSKQPKKTKVTQVTPRELF